MLGVVTNWWALVLRGIAAIAFALLTFAWPGISLTVLVLMFGAYAFVDGVFAIVAALRAPKEFQRWWILLVEGILSVLAGIIAFVLPGITALVAVVLIAAWAIVTGIAEIIAAVQLRKYITGEWLLALGGVVSIIFGILMLMNPGAGALAVVWLIGAYALFFGVLLVALGMKLRRVLRTHSPAPA